MIFILWILFVFGMHWPCPCQRRFHWSPTCAPTDADDQMRTDALECPRGDCPEGEGGHRAHGTQRRFLHGARERSILCRWTRLATYAYGRKRLHVLASALGEILKVYKSRRVADTSTSQGMPSRRTFRSFSTFEHHWLRFACHAYKSKSLGQLAGALLTYFQDLNKRGRILPCKSTTKKSRK